MPTECISAQFEFEGFARRRVVAGFDGGAITSDAGALLLRHADRAIDLVRRVAGCFRDGRREDLVVHQTSTLVGQRIVAIALGYEDVDDHDTLRFDPVLGLLSDRLEPKRDDCARLAGKSTLNRLERSAASDLNPRYHKLTHDAEALESLFVDLFLDAHKRPPKRIVLDVDATALGEDHPRRGATGVVEDRGVQFPRSFDPFLDQDLGNQAAAQAAPDQFRGDCMSLTRGPRRPDAT